LFFFLSLSLLFSLSFFLLIFCYPPSLLCPLPFIGFLAWDSIVICPRIMIWSGTLCFGGIGTPIVLSSLDYWWRFPRPGGNLVAVEKSRLERGQMLCI
jgi:hypothetical protein